MSNLGAIRFRVDRYDSYMDIEKAIWLESACGDEECEYCSTRPSSPYNPQHSLLLTKIYGYLYYSANYPAWTIDDQRVLHKAKTVLKDWFLYDLHVPYDMISEWEDYVGSFVMLFGDKGETFYGERYEDVVRELYVLFGVA